MALSDIIYKCIPNWFSEVVLDLGAVALAVNTVAIPIAYHRNQNITAQEETVVFTSGNQCPFFPSVLSAAVAPFFDFIFYIPVTLRENILGRKVTWKSNASVDEILDTLSDSRYQNVVFIGHGTGNSYLAADKYLYASTLSFNIEPRTGEVTTYTCGKYKPTIRDFLAQDQSKSFGYDSPQHFGTIIFDSWKRWYDVAYDVAYDVDSAASTPVSTPASTAAKL